MSVCASFSALSLGARMVSEASAHYVSIQVAFIVVFGTECFGTALFKSENTFCASSTDLAVFNICPGSISLDWMIITPPLAVRLHSLSLIPQNYSLFFHCPLQAPLASSRNGIASSVRLAVAQPRVAVAQRAAVVEVAAGKLKTRKSAAKRFKITGSGKVLRRQCGKQHLNEKMSRSTKNSLSRYASVSTADHNNVRKNVGNDHV